MKLKLVKERRCEQKRSLPLLSRYSFFSLFARKFFHFFVVKFLQSWATHASVPKYGELNYLHDYPVMAWWITKLDFLPEVAL